MKIENLRKLRAKVLLDKFKKVTGFFYFEMPEKIRAKAILLLQVALEKSLTSGDLELAEDVTREIVTLFAISSNPEIAAKVIAEANGLPLLLSYLENTIKKSPSLAVIENQLEKALGLLNDFGYDKENFLKQMEALSEQVFPIASSIVVRICNEKVREMNEEPGLDHPVMQKVIFHLKQMVKSKDQDTAMLAINELKKIGINDIKYAGSADEKSTAASDQQIIESKNESGFKREDSGFFNLVELLASAETLSNAIVSDPGIVNRPLADGRTLAHVAAQSTGDFSWNVFHTLFESKVDLTIRDKKGQTPIHTAAYMSHTREMSAAFPLFIQAAVKQGFDLSCKDALGNTVLHAVAHSSDSCVGNLIREVPHIDLDAVNSHGMTPITIALLRGNFESVRFLAASGASITKKESSVLEVLENTIFERRLLWQLDEELMGTALLEKEAMLKAQAAAVGIYTEEDYAKVFKNFYVNKEEEEPADAQHDAKSEAESELTKKREECWHAHYEFQQKKNKFMADKHDTERFLEFRDELIKIENELNISKSLDRILLEAFNQHFDLIEKDTACKDSRFKILFQQLETLGIRLRPVTQSYIDRLSLPVEDKITTDSTHDKITEHKSDDSQKPASPLDQIYNNIASEIFKLGLKAACSTAAKWNGDAAAISSAVSIQGWWRERMQLRAKHSPIKDNKGDAKDSVVFPVASDSKTEHFNSSDAKAETVVKNSSANSSADITKEIQTLRSAAEAQHGAFGSPTYAATAERTQNTAQPSTEFVATNAVSVPTVGSSAR